MTIPQCSPQRNYLAHREEIDAAIARVLASGRYILGEEVEAFERELAAYLGGGECVGVASGTDALHLACRALDLGPGDEAIVPGPGSSRMVSGMRPKSRPPSSSAGPCSRGQGLTTNVW